MSETYVRRTSARAVGRRAWRWRRLILLLVAAAVLITVVSSWSPPEHLGTASTQGPGALLGGHPAAADVTVGATTVGASGDATTVVRITNHSSKMSNYLVGLTVTSARGQAMHRADVSVSKLQPGATTTEKAVWAEQNGPLPAGAKVVVETVDRWAQP